MYFFNFKWKILDENYDYEFQTKPLRIPSKNLGIPIGFLGISNKIYA